MDAIAATNDYSSVSKASMASVGYIDDQFITRFVAKCSKRTPLIHRGYFIRVWVIAQLIENFIKHCVQKSLRAQIVSLGAGFDSVYFRLRSQGVISESTVFVEIDQRSVVRNKHRVVSSNPEAFNISGSSEIRDESDEVLAHFGFYHLVSCDLRNSSAVLDVLRRCSIDFSAPCLFLAECVLNYMDPEISDDLLRKLSQNFDYSCCVLYEQVQPATAFGIFMRNHFDAIGSNLKSICRYPSLLSQESRLSDLGWKHFLAPSLNWFYYQILPEAERQRLAAIEPFDEYEVFDILNSHYTIVIGCSNGSLSSVLLDDFCCAKEYSSWRVQWSDLMPATLITAVSARFVSATRYASSFQRYSHSVVQLSSNMYLVAGGVCHRRCSDVVLIKVSAGIFDAVKIDSCYKKNLEQLDDLKVERLYHTMTLLPDGRCLIYGGRFSPNSPVSESVLLTFNKESLDVQKEIFEPSIQIVCRWRHAAVFCPINSCDYVIVSGGLSKDNQVLQDCWMIDINKRTTTKLTDLPVPLHSHCCSVWNNDFLVVSGGFNCESVSSVVFLYNIASDAWTTLNFKILPRYGHTAHVFSDNLIMLGGCNHFENTSFPILTVLNLKDRIARNYAVQTCDGDTKLLVFGGGGNCFSFGTLLNPLLLEINMNGII